MRTTMANKGTEVERYYVGQTNYKKRSVRAREQF